MFQYVKWEKCNKWNIKKLKHIESKQIYLTLSRVNNFKVNLFLH